MNETAKTYINVAVMLVAAAILGCLLGDSIRYMLGTNSETLSSTVFNDRMGVVKQVFTEENATFQLVCENVVTEDRGDFRVVRTKSDKLMAVKGSVVAPLSEVLDADTAEAVSALFFAKSEALATAKDYAGEPITDVEMTMMTYEGGQIRWYLYASGYGWIGVVYADKSVIETSMDIVKLSTDEQYEDGWGIFYTFE